MNTALKKARILLPTHDVDLSKWAVVACDQFTSQPSYWNRVAEIVGDAPSTLKLTLPEAMLSESAQRIPMIQAAMRDYLYGGALEEAVDGFVLVERTTPSGVRPGLVVALDLEQYDYSDHSKSLIRATEGTVASRVPARAAIRSGALLEVPHVMMLIDDPHRTVIEPLYAQRDRLSKLYDFDLMLDGGHLRGWSVEGADADKVFEAVDALAQNCGGLLYAVGDGNHSLAAAKQCWCQLRETLTPDQREDHPARYAMVELVNLGCPALKFEPIHRVIYNVNFVELTSGLQRFLRQHGVEDAPGEDLIAFNRDARMTFRSVQYPLPLLQRYLDDYIGTHPEAEIDYIHGEAELREAVASKPDAMGFLLRAFDKSELFGAIRRWGVLPRKAFSMGTAREKRYYMETRRIL